MRITSARFEWKLPDLWVGAFWKTTYAQTDAGRRPKFTDVWLCLIPCVPFHLTLEHQLTIPVGTRGRDHTARGGLPEVTGGNVVHDAPTAARTLS